MGSAHRHLVVSREAQQRALSVPHRSRHMAIGNPVATMYLDAAITEFGDRVGETHLDQA